MGKPWKNHGKALFLGKTPWLFPWFSLEILGNPTVPGSDFAAVPCEADRDDVIVTREALEVHSLGFLSQLLRDLAVCQNLVPLVNPKIAGKWMFIPVKMVLIRY